MLVVGGLLAVALWPATIPVDVVDRAARGPLVVTVDEEGRTRVRDRFVVSAPVAGRVLRIELEPGDPVKRGGDRRPGARRGAAAARRADARGSAGGGRKRASGARPGAGRSSSARVPPLAQAQRELARVRELAADELDHAAQEIDAARGRTRRRREEAVNAAVISRCAPLNRSSQRAQARLAPSTPDASGPRRRRCARRPTASC